MLDDLRRAGRERLTPVQALALLAELKKRLGLADAWSGALGSRHSERARVALGRDDSTRTMSAT